MSQYDLINNLLLLLKFRESDMFVFPSLNMWQMLESGTKPDYSVLTSKAPQVYCVQQSRAHEEVQHHLLLLNLWPRSIVSVFVEENGKIKTPVSLLGILFPCSTTSAQPLLKILVT